MTSSARRQLFRRSKAGCWNCRSKKKKCDELRPHCTRCLRAGEGCRYPDTSSESLVESSHPMSPVDRASPSITSSTSFPGGMSMHTSPMLSRSSSTSGYSSQHPSRRPPHTPYHHHPYAPTSEHHVYASPSDHHRAALQHQEYHAQRPASHQRPLTPPSSAAPYPYYAGSHPMAQTHPSHQHFVPPPLSASAATDWDHTSQQHLYKRPRYDDLSSSSSTASSHPVYQDARSRQPFEPHHRIPSNHSQTSSKGKTRDTLPPISPIRPESIPMTISASLPPINGVSPPSHRVMASPSFASRSADTSPANRVSPVVAKHHAFSAASPNGFPEHLPAPTVSPPNQASAPLAYRAERTDAQLDAPLSPSPQPASTLAQPRHKLVFDYASNDPDPAHFLHVLQELPQSVVTQPTKGAHAYFGLLQAIARMPHGQAMAHALAAMAASHQANSDIAPQLPNESSDKVDSPSVPSRATLVELANRHHLSAIKALQTQQQPSRRRRFSVIETNNTNTADELPPASNAATMMLLIHACSSISKSLMLPSYFNQCEQFLADAVEHVSTHRLFPSVSGQAIVGSPEDPPIFPPDNLTNYGGLLFLGSAVGLYECYLSQFTAITDWDYNPSRLKRLLPFNWTDSDAAVFDQTRKSASETTLSVSMVTLELVIETLDTMRKLMRAETTAYGGRKSSRSEAEDGTAALDSLALREELGLVIRDLEQGAFWKGAARTLSEAEQRSVLLYASGQPVDNDVAAETEHASHIDDAEHSADEPVTKIFQSGSLFLPSSSAERKRVVNRLRLANHLYRNALLVDLYVTVFHRPASSLAVRQLVERSIALLRAVPEQREQGLMWPAIVLGSYAQDDKERSQVRNFVQRSQWKSTTGSSTASDVLERVWADDSDSWRESVSYFGSPYIS